jgi:glycerophosphoryl diester phosphodiesterase
LGSAGPDYHFSEFYRYTDWIESCHALGLKVNVWTVNKKEDMQYFWDKVDFITTDEPLGLLKDIMKVK